MLDPNNPILAKVRIAARRTAQFLYIACVFPTAVHQDEVIVSVPVSETRLHLCRYYSISRMAPKPTSHRVFLGPILGSSNPEHNERSHKQPID